jgi:protein TonB
MIAASRSIAAGALVAALLAHGALAWALIGETDMQIEGGAGAPETRLGTSFADMVAGTMAPERATDMAQPVKAEAQAALRSGPAEAAPLAPLKAERAPPSGAGIPAISEAVAPAVPAAQVPRPAQTLTSPDAVRPAVTSGLRPKRRSPEFEAAHARAAPQPEPKPKSEQAAKPEQAAKSANQGNAQKNAAVGTATGNTAAKATATGAGTQQPHASGNAAASNYPGLVMQKISRVPRPRSTSRGTAVVGFSVAGGGGLASAHIASSSGSGPLDQAALQMIQRAAPFPPPPPGAQRSFTISIKGR